MGQTRLGLDWIDVIIQAGITIAVGVAVAAVFRDVAGTTGEEMGVGLVVATSLAILGWRRSRALKAAPALSSGEYQSERVADLESRMAEMEAQQGRMAELEERLDFTERLLAQHREAPRVGPGER